MLEKIKNWLKKKEKGYVSHIKFKATIKALAMETYRDVTVIYVSKPKADGGEQPIYHFFFKKEFYDDTADTLSQLETLAHDRIDQLK